MKAGRHLVEPAADSVPRRSRDAGEIIRDIIARTGGDIRLALPLGLGKPVTLVNALTRAAAADPSIKLSIFTALTLERPEPSTEIERRFLGPARDRLFGAYPQLHYAKMLREGTLPVNITVNEFFFMAGRWLGVEPAQRSYISANYTHARDVLIARKPNVLMQLLAESAGRFSLSCNTDISTDLFAFRAEGRMDFIAVGEVSDELPFMGGAAVIEADELALVLDASDARFELFSALKRPVSHAEHAIGMHVSGLVVDGGTLQIGIGQIGDAVAHALLLRHRQSSAAIWKDAPFGAAGETGAFGTGLYAVTEMLVDGLLALFEAGVVNREVSGHVIHAGFFVGPREFYRRLRQMPDDERAKIAMVPVSFTNALYGDETAKRIARTDARFVNSAMSVSCLGDVMSDSAKVGQVVSGVGGQFNFVEQAFALNGARSIVTLPATREKNGVITSNILWDLPVTTVPRHMRDIVVTEYGVADLRGQPDEAVIARLIGIADSRFQAKLVRHAKAAGKLAMDFEIPLPHRRNTPEAVLDWLEPHGHLLPRFPFGTDFDDIEQTLLPALEHLKKTAEQGRLALLLSIWRSLFSSPAPEETAAMERMGYLGKPHFGEGLQARALRAAVRQVVARAAD